MANDLILAGELLTELINKYYKIQKKKHLYKDIKDLTVIEINTIIVIGSKCMKSMSEIANILGVSYGTPTITVDRLIKKGYVERIRDEEDRRQVFVKLSEKGENVLVSIDTLKNNVAEKIFEILTEEERKSFVSILSKLNSQIDKIYNF